MPIGKTQIATVELRCDERLVVMVLHDDPELIALDPTEIPDELLAEYIDATSRYWEVQRKLRGYYVH